MDKDKEKQKVISAYMAKIGSKGGKKVTPRKLRALKRNAQKPRPRKPKEEDIS